MSKKHKKAGKVASKKKQNNSTTLIVVAVVGIIAIGLAVFIAASNRGGSRGAPAPGGPPNIPHAISANTDCLSCHKTGNNGAKVTPHPTRPNCTNCHKPVTQ